MKYKSANRLILILILPLLPLFSVFEQIKGITRQMRDDLETWKDSWDSNA